MERSIRGAGWMTEPTRTEALAKLAGFTYKIGYPDRWRDYGGLEIDRASHAGNRMRAAAFEHDREVGRLDEPVDRGEWGMPPHIVNAYYNPLLNEIVFPAGILQPPFFDDDADDATNFGAIGAVIGHEITHGFDDQGSHFDAAGRFREWWTAEDRAEFERRAQVLVEQYDGYEVEDGVHVNGRLTLGENIADLGGIAIAFDALREAVGDLEAPLGGRLHAGAAVLPVVGRHLAHEHHRGAPPADGHRRPALADELPGQRLPRQLPALRHRLRRPRGLAHGPRRGPPGPHLVGAAPGAAPAGGPPNRPG